jgi:hypothetical protein
MALISLSGTSSFLNLDVYEHCHFTKCVPTLFPEVWGLCVRAICEVFAAKIMCTPLIHLRQLHYLSLSVS